MVSFILSFFAIFKKILNITIFENAYFSVDHPIFFKTSLEWLESTNQLKIQPINLVSSVYITGWWFGTFFKTVHILGIIIPTDFHIFQRGWNHQPDNHRQKKICHTEMWGDQQQLRPILKNQLAEASKNVVRSSPRKNGWNVLVRPDDQWEPSGKIVGTSGIVLGSYRYNIVTPSPFNWVTLGKTWGDLY